MRSAALMRRFAHLIAQVSSRSPSLPEPQDARGDTLRAQTNPQPAPAPGARPVPELSYDDTLDGGNGTDHLDGGPDTDACTRADTSAGCERTTGRE